MPRVRLICLWLVICCACSFGGTLAFDRSASNDQLPAANQLLAATATQSSATDPLDTRPGSSFLSKRQLVELKRSIVRVREDMRTIENGLVDSSLTKDQLIGLQRKANKRLQSLDRRISKYLRQSANLEKVARAQPEQRTDQSSNELDPIDQQLSSANNIKMSQDPNFFFSPSSSSSSSSVSPPHFWHVDASASTTRHSSSNGSGSSSSSSTHSPDLLSSGSVSSSSPPSNSSNSLSANSPDPFQSNTNSSNDDSFKIVNKPEAVDLSASKERESNRSVKDGLSEIVNSTSAKLDETLDRVRIKSKIDRFTGGLIGALNNLIHSPDASSQQTPSVKQEEHPFLLYHKCSEGYLQLAGDGSLSTGMDPNLLAKSEFILHYLTKPHNHQLQIQTQDDRYLCFNAQGRPEIMASLDEPMCTFQIIYHKKEYIQLASVRNAMWTLGFNRRGIPIRARASQKRRNKRKPIAPNPCTLFIRQRSDEQLLQRLADLTRDQREYRQKITAHNAQIKQIERSNNPLTQDSLIMAKIERLRRRRDGRTS